MSSADVSPRVIGSTSYILLVARVQLVVAVFLIAVLSDLMIDGSMREVMRYAIMDAPWQIPAIVVALLLACVAIRFTCEATMELVAPDLFNAPGNAGRLAHLLPRALAIALGFAVALPLFRLALDPNAMAREESRFFAALAGTVFVIVGIVVGAIARGPRTADAAGEPRMPSFLLRLSLLLVPLAFTVVVCGAVLGLWGKSGGIARGAIERYQDGGGLQMAAEAFALFFSCIAARLAMAIAIDLVAPSFGTREGLSRIFHGWLPRLASVGLSAGVAVQLYLIYALPPAEPPTDETLIWLWATIAVCILIGFAASAVDGTTALVEDQWNAFQRAGRRWVGAAERMSTLGSMWQWFFAGLMVLAVAVFFLFYDVSLVSMTQRFGPVAIILLWGFTAAVLFFPLAYLAHMTRMPLLLILLVAAVVFSGFDLNDNHELRQADVAALPAGAVEPPTDYQERLNLAKWIESRGDWNRYERYPVFLIATEGGGIRAAYFTASVLAAFQERCPAFAQHTLAISSVSGGSVGAAVFAALVADHAKNVDDADCNLAGGTPGDMVARARQVLATDLLSPLLGATLFPDAVQRILPVPINRFDRSRALEFALEDSWRAANPDHPARMSEETATLYRHTEPRNPVPHLLMNTTEAATGKTVPFATLDVGSLATPFIKSAQIDDPGPASFKLLILHHRMVDDHVPLSAAAIVSARFPFLTPAGTVGGRRHYVDGGYFENSGTWLLSGIVENLIGQRLAYRNAQNPALEAAVRNAVFITVVIQSSPCTSAEAGAVCEDAAPSDASWNEVMSPVRALLHTRDKRAEYSSNDLTALTALIEQMFQQIPTADGSVREAGADPQLDCRDVICAVTLRFHNAPGVEVPLSWLLSSQARAAMDQAVDGMEAADVRVGAPAREAPPNSIGGSYRRIVCILDARKQTPGCNEPIREPAPAPHPRTQVSVIDR